MNEPYIIKRIVVFDSEYGDYPLEIGDEVHVKSKDSDFHMVIEKFKIGAYNTIHAIGHLKGDKKYPVAARPEHCRLD